VRKLIDRGYATASFFYESEYLTPKFPKSCIIIAMNPDNVV
jgi:hypothetical protein